MSDLVSIIMPSYNSQGFIKDAIASVVNQTYINWELIIVDDNSLNQNEIEQIASSFNDKRIIFIKNSLRGGAAKARNIATKVAKGRYIAFLDSDDIFKPNKLKVQVEFLVKFNLAFTYSSYDLIDTQGKKIGEFKTNLEITHNDLLKTCSIGCSSVIYDTNKLGKIFMQNFKNREDYVTWLEITKTLKIVKGIEQPLLDYRIYKNQTSSNKLKMAKYQWKVYRNHENLGLLKSIYYFLHYTVNGLLKYKIKR